MDGVLVIDKPVGFTSHDVVQQVRRWAHQRRVGHLGTLDPLATGVLPIALGEATKLSRLLTLGEKVYRGCIRLGVETTTYDREGDEVARVDGPWPERAVVSKALEPFRGLIQQVPPPYSAVKRGGEAAYRKARRGERVELEPREVTIYELRLLDYAPPDIHVEVRCSSGTYLRSLAYDLGRQIGCGGTLWDLSRLQSGPFRIESALPLDSLAERGVAVLVPMAKATHLPSYEVDARTAERVAHGVQLGRHEVRGAPTRGTLQLVRRGRLVALLDAETGIPELRTVRVFLEGTEG